MSLALAGTPEPLLLAERMHKRYGGVHALRGATLEVGRGEVHALVGENGSGKSTMLKLLSGQVLPDGGTITFAGAPVTFRRPTDALRHGIATVTQETTLAPDLSIAENVFLGHRMVKRGPVIDWRATRQRAREALDRLGIDIDLETAVRRLRPDQQQMVEIARALSMDARLVILDEPTSSLTDDEVETLFALVGRLREEGVTTIFVSHRLQEVFALADRVTVLRDGHSVGGGALDTFDRAKLIHLMVGRELEEISVTAVAAPASNAGLRLRGLTSPGHFEDIDLDVAPGEIVGLAGLVGAGRSELLEAVFGLHPPSAGSVEVDGVPVRFRSPRAAVRGRVGFVPADRKLQGLVLEMSVRENLVMAATARSPRLSPPRVGREGPIVSEAVSRMRIRAHSPGVPVSTLSGGNQQKVVLGKWLATRPHVLLLDEPTRGVDVGAKSEIYRLLLEAAEQGIAVLVSSSELPELQLLCDRIVVMFRGRMVASLARDEATEARIAHFAGGHQ
ncbi:MAG: sugar ABC transporter ATP-binding protein [Gaiellales bacterium]